jgi:ABC-type phosphate transport system permease subunit
VQERAYASALILLILVLAVNFIARVLSLKFSKHTIQ